MKAAFVLLLVAPAASLHLRDDACACIPWDRAYANHNVKCGQGYEYSAIDKWTAFGQKSFAERIPLDKLPKMVDASDEWKTVMNEYCTFYKAANFTGCLNRKVAAISEQWCYVSEECKGASSVEGTDLAIKWCSESDKLMNNSYPEEVNRLAGLIDQEAGLLGKLSFALSDMIWSDVEGASGLAETELLHTHTWDSFFVRWTLEICEEE